MRPRRLLVLPVALLLAGCHLLLPFGEAAREVPGDLAPAEQRDRGGDLRDARVHPDLPACFGETFVSQAWKVKVGPGIWAWLPTGEARQTALYPPLHAFLQPEEASGLHLRSAVLSSKMTVEELLANEYWHGVGLALLIAPGSGGEAPYRQVSCTAMQHPSKPGGAPFLGIVHYDGKMVVSDLLPTATGAPAVTAPIAPIVGSTIELQMKILVSSNTWVMECSLVGGPKLTGDFSSLVAGYTPIGFALGTYTARARFDDLVICPVSGE